MAGAKQRFSLRASNFDISGEAQGEGGYGYAGEIPADHHMQLEVTVEHQDNSGNWTESLYRDVQMGNSRQIQTEDSPNGQRDYNDLIVHLTWPGRSRLPEPNAHLMAISNTESLVAELGVTPRQFSAYAPPMIWGDWSAIANHFGSVTYGIHYTGEGDTLVIAQVRYYSAAKGGIRVIEDFQDDVVITTSASIGAVEVRFKGTPTGTPVRGIVAP
jgi:hypothetical protein